MRRGQSPEDADDLVHDAWIKLASFALTQPVEQPEAFLMKAALNLSVDAHRAQSVRGEQVLPEDVVIIDTRPSVDDVVLGRERMDRLYECLARMNETTRTLYLAHRVEGVSYNELAKQHGMSRSGVEWHVSKAVMLTASWMEGWYP